MGHGFRAHSYRGTHGLGLVEATLGNWFRAERSRMQEVEESDGQALSGAEQRELVNLRYQVGG